jgi:hypothetical protein
MPEPTNTDFVVAHELASKLDGPMCGDADLVFRSGKIADAIAQARAEGAASRDAEVQQLRERVAELEAALGVLYEEYREQTEHRYCICGSDDDHRHNVACMRHQKAIEVADAALAQKGGE